MKFISWNIDSINAALTGTSTRAGETRAVLKKISALEPDAVAIQETKLSKNGPTKKHLQVLADLFPDTRLPGAVRSSRHGRAMLVLCISTETNTSQRLLIRKSGPRSQWIVKAGSLPWNSLTFS